MAFEDSYRKDSRVLVVSHNCFSRSGSNGRTLANFFKNWSKDSIAQFYITNEIPNSEVCDNYFRVTDIEALKALYKGIKVGEIIDKKKYTEDVDMKRSKFYERHKKRSSFHYLARNFVWDINRWRSLEFDQWVDDFNPEVILLQLGDYAFMLRIALKLATTRNIPLVIYNSEDYYFKDKKSISPLYHIYRSDYKRQVKKLMSYASSSIYNSVMLQHTYNQEFQHNSTVMMTATDMTPAGVSKSNSSFQISYLGNLGVGRHEPLIEIANTLQSISKELYLDIYGKAPSEEVENLLTSCEGIRFNGYVSYDEVVSIMKSSDLLIHAENFSEFYQWDLKHAFSTKIADSLASGTCFFIYAPEGLACVEYLMDKKAACVVTSKQELRRALSNVIHSKDLREVFINNALLAVDENHNIVRNANIFRTLICNVAEKVSR